MTLRQAIRAVAAAALISMLGACSGGLLPQPDPPQLYMLSPKSTFRDDLPKVDWQLIVEVPISSAGLNTTRLVLIRNFAEFEYFARAAWTDTAPQMVQTLLIESFENTDRIVSVGRESVGLRADYLLKTELREFQAEYEMDTQPPTARIRLNAKLVRMSDRTIIGSRNEEAKVKAEGTDMPSILAAYDDALGKVLKRVIEWTVMTGAKDMPPEEPLPAEPAPRRPPAPR